ncbi:uncharacterized protein [Parasteatoda tepidariorum]|uniref:uncharacterized protein n=1 Tax=Parasteatoda tepidariorum TaxID=114398 RepID=UPI001C71CB65|nr:uncharacterized protein LOC122270513 [Parasteatoda tepidariorum]
MHKTSLHAGLQIMLSRVREKYWICGARRLMKKIISQCTICLRFKAKHLETPPASLPKDRIINSAAFQITGIDYAGPLYLKNVQNLSTHAFLNALRRFIARRGRVYTIYTDNGTNFHETNNKLRELNWEEIQDSSSIHRINWKFIPPSSAWWGGFWERMSDESSGCLPIDVKISYLIVGFDF